MNSYRRGLRSGALVNPKLFILEKVNLGPPTIGWSNFVKLVKILYYSVRVVTGSTFFLRSMEIGQSFSDWPRFKVGVLDESYAWIPKTPSFAKVRAEGSGSQKASGLGSVRGTSSKRERVAHASRGREPSY